MRWLILLGLVGCSGHLRWVEAADGGPVAGVVREAEAAARAEGKILIVYVGAKWCEPCERFHQAAQTGALDKDFSHLYVLAFDLDRDHERLLAAGYDSALIPLLVVPQADGRAGPRRMFGSIKGDGAVAEMAPRLRVLLEGK